MAESTRTADEIVDAIARRKHTQRGNLGSALMELGKAVGDLGNAIRISPMAGVEPATQAGIEHAFESLGTARTKMNTALVESQAIEQLENELEDIVGTRLVDFYRSAGPHSNTGDQP